MNICIIGDRYSNPDSKWLKHLPKHHNYHVYFLPYGNYINFFELLTWLNIHNIIKEHKLEHFLIQSGNAYNKPFDVTPNLCFYEDNYLDNMLFEQKENFTFRYADNKYLLWTDNVFSNSIGDEIQKRYNMNLNEIQINYLQRFVNNNSINSIMKGSEIRLKRLLKRLDISYQFVTNTQEKILINDT